MEEGKVNKYGFIHVNKALMEKMGFDRGTEVPLELEYDPATNSIIAKIQTRGTVVAEETPKAEETAAKIAMERTRARKAKAKK